MKYLFNKIITQQNWNDWNLSLQIFDKIVCILKYLQPKWIKDKFTPVNVF